MNHIGTLQTRQLMSGKLLQWQQVVMDVLHPGKAKVPQTDSPEKQAKMYETVPDVTLVCGFRAHGGGTVLALA